MWWGVPVRSTISVLWFSSNTKGPRVQAAPVALTPVKVTEPPSGAVTLSRPTPKLQLPGADREGALRLLRPRPSKSAR